VWGSRGKASTGDAVPPSSAVFLLQETSHKFQLEFLLSHFSAKEPVYSQGVDHSHVQKVEKYFFLYHLMVFLVDL